jgi:adenosylcobinamide amidohydrolase
MTIACEQLVASDQFLITRAGRFLIAELRLPHRVLSTSVRNGGQQDRIRYLVNHQSCEPAKHQERHDYMVGMGLAAYHDVVSNELGLDPASVALMGTAANMNNVAVVQRSAGDLSVTAAVTGGVESNATCSGDPAGWQESSKGWEKRPEYTGTINTILLIGHSVTDGALARAIITMAEAKSAALNRLAVRSRQSQDMATGTGTDQFCVAAPVTEEKPLTSTSTHVLLGELIGSAVRDATLEALRWQNGLEPSYTRSLFYALRCYGIGEETFWEQIGPLLPDRALELLKANSRAVFGDPLIAASAYALAATLDRGRYGTLPSNALRGTISAQAATLAVHLSVRPDLWPVFHAELAASEPPSPAHLILNAICLGWKAKWATHNDRSSDIAQC